MPDSIVIVSTIPGRHRGGRAHPLKAAYEIGTFTAEQLTEIMADPAMVVVRGALVTKRDIAELAPKPKKAGEAA